MGLHKGAPCTAIESLVATIGEAWSGHEDRWARFNCFDESLPIIAAMDLALGCRIMKDRDKGCSTAKAFSWLREARWSRQYMWESGSSGALFRGY